LWQPYGPVDIAPAIVLPTETEIYMAKEPSRTYASPSVETGGPLTSNQKPKGKGKWKITAVLFLVVLPLAAFALWVTIALNYTYSSGERSGYVQKLSKKGFVCKTQEGEIALVNGPNVNPEIFKFTVRSDSLAAQISNLAGKQVKLTYEQHLGLPTSCFGETQYFVSAVEAIGASAPVTAPAVAPAAGPAAIPATTPAATPVVTPAAPTSKP
jgi:hypothetical protein